MLELAVTMTPLRLILFGCIHALNILEGGKVEVHVSGRLMLLTDQGT